MTARRRSRRPHARALWVLLAVADVVLAAFWWDSGQGGAVVLAVVLSVVLAGFGESRRHTRRRTRGRSARR